MGIHALVLSLCTWLLMAGPAVLSREAAPEVRVLRVPGGGLQPHALADDTGTLHLVYLGGDPKAADVWYVRKPPGAAGFEPPIRVNSQEGSAIALGTVRGPRMALGRNARVHIVWNGSGKAEPRGPEGVRGASRDPLLYARLNDTGTGFEAQRCLATATTLLDGGGSVAADAEGGVYAGWHAAPLSGPTEESARRFFVATSEDEGATFGPEQGVSPEGLGACACCGTAGFVGTGGGVHFLYRAATEQQGRDMQWLSSGDRGRTFTVRGVHPWNVNQCPMSTASIGEGPATARPLVLAWETQGQVYFACVDPKSGEMSKPASPAGEGDNRKHPSVGVDAQGRVLLAWTEGTAWAKGGSVAWEVFSPDGTPYAGTRQTRTGADGVGAWNSVAAVFADGRFLVLY